jgi:GAF domain-containing protein
MNASKQQNKRHAQIAADLRDMTLLYEVALRCVREGSEFHECLKAIVDAAIALTAADKGNIQLIDPPSRALVIAVQRGFDPPFLKFFERVSDGSSACGAAMERGKHVLVEDVQQSAVFAGKPSLEVMLQAGVRAVLSVPLVSSRGTVFGMISTHFKSRTGVMNVNCVSWICSQNRQRSMWRAVLARSSSSSARLLPRNWEVSL